MTQSITSDAEERRHPSRLAANVYLAVGIAVLILTGGSDTTLGRYLIGSAVEIGLALLILLFLRIENVRARPALRIRRPIWTTVGLAVALVPAFWLSGIVLNLIAVMIFGYVTPMPPSTFPSNVGEALALAATTMVVAPICEELMFRGYVFRAYEHRRVWLSIGVTSLIFALYHLRLQGVFALIPISIGLGLVTWRTESVLPSIAMHAAYNGISTLIIVATSFFSMQLVGIITGTAICLGLLTVPFSLLALLALWKRTTPSTPEPAKREQGWLRWAWILPLVGLMFVYGYGAASEFLLGRFPERFSDQELKLTIPEDWQQPTKLTYEIQNPTGNRLGEAKCVRTPRDAGYRIECYAQYEGFNLLEDLPGFAQVDSEEWQDWIETMSLPDGVPTLTRMLKGDPGSWMLNAEWAKQAATQSLTLQTLNGTKTTMTQTVTTTLTSEPTTTLTTVLPTGRTATLNPDGALFLLHEWPWRLEGLPFELGYGDTITFVTLSEEGLPVSHRAYIHVQGGEPTWTGGDTVITWRVTMTYGGLEERTLTAWYRAEPPHTLMRYDDGQVSYVLQSKTEIN